ncbi:hypothetical protein B0T24DRAFT_31775 [Lasiosphaeria ovina]|uniref:Uncharacterized protein n=1 Tax=Lasiosphaeria ovina TaxID=92902 RepID=A0AAE0TXC6_9PEZI|nr:hypothetical protein B0T24DRAFT_31775 [Lasiosphaeria ovina]
MSAPTSEQIRQLGEQARPFAPETSERRPSMFLSLAPKTSDSYPRAQKSKQPKPEALTAEALAEVPKQDDAATLDMKRRTSSLSSDGSKSRLRFLKLGPVHWGEHQDEHGGDFHEVAVE